VSVLLLARLLSHLENSGECGWVRKTGKWKITLDELWYLSQTGACAVDLVPFQAVKSGLKKSDTHSRCLKTCGMMLVAICWRPVLVGSSRLFLLQMALIFCYLSVAIVQGNPAS